MIGIVDEQALAIVFHRVAGQTEGGGFGSSHFSRETQEAAKDRLTFDRLRRNEFNSM
jgi:hypothetical protein